jgi:predicted Rossmann fold nucleotide-binding protein DprA/Smf involved in DNA uptake
MKRVIVAGSREFTNYELLKETLDSLHLQHTPDIEIVSGGARGADKMGERYAKERGIRVEVFPAQWDTYGKSAGYKRNQQMADHADTLIAFWDGVSKGTKHMIDIAKAKNINVILIRI